jgi:hypothetical protein
MCCLILACKIFELQYRMGCVDGGCALWDAFTQVEQICCESKPNAYFGLQCLSMFYRNFSCWKYKKVMPQAYLYLQVNSWTSMVKSSEVQGHSTV